MTFDAIELECVRDDSHHAEHCDPTSKEHVWCLDLWLTRWLNSDPTLFAKVLTEKAAQQPRAVIFQVIISLMVSVQALEEAEFLPSQEYEFSYPPQHHCGQLPLPFLSRVFSAEA